MKKWKKWGNVVAEIVKKIKVNVSTLDFLSCFQWVTDSMASFGNELEMFQTRSQKFSQDALNTQNLLWYDENFVFVCLKMLDLNLWLFSPKDKKCIVCVCAFMLCDYQPTDKI